MTFLVPLLFFARLLVTILMMIMPILCIIMIVRFIKEKKYLSSLVSLLGIIFCVGIFYLLFFTQTVSPQVNKQSVSNNKDILLSLKNGCYSFNTEYIEGYVFVNNFDENHNSYLNVDKNANLYLVDNELGYSLSSIYCCKDERWYYLFYPTMSIGEIIIYDSQKCAHIEYSYNDINFSSVIGFLTNPEVIYRKEIYLSDIIECLVYDEQLTEEWYQE